ncbi:MAG: SEC-C metal-binding domain-containing protein, partial [Marmoricola sp.]
AKETVAKNAPIIRAKGLDAPKKPQNLTYAGPSEDGDSELRSQPASNADDPFTGVGRNEQCPCGSGKKYKQCHGAPNATGLTTRAGG